MDVGDGRVEKMCWKKKNYWRGEWGRRKNHPSDAPRVSICVDLEQPPIIIAPVRFCIRIHPRVSSRTSIFVILCLSPYPSPHSNYSSPSDTRHQTIVTHRALLKHPSWRRRGAQWNIISYVRSRSSGKHIILSPTVAAMVVVVMVKIVVR
jgi:hypothetical protein